MADKPSRALIVYGDGLMRFVDSSHIHLHSLASRSLCGFLSLPHAPPSETENSRILRELTELLDASESFISAQDSNCIPARFMGMKAALVTNNLELQSLGSKLGFRVIASNELVKSVLNINEMPSETAARELLKLLGFKDKKTSESYQYDMVVVHIGAGENSLSARDQNMLAGDLDFLNSLVGAVMELANPGSETSSRLHFSAVMSYGEVTEKDGSFNLISSDEYRNSGLSAVIPRQSYTMKGGHPRANVRHYTPMLVAQSRDGVTRRDKANVFSFENFKYHGANLTIPADRLLHEVAFKLWKAPKSKDGTDKKGGYEAKSRLGISVNTSCVGMHLWWFLCGLSWSDD